MHRSSLVLVAAAVMASSVPACVSPPPPEITVYSRRDFHGARMTLRDGYADLEREIPEVEDDISSFEIHRGVWQVCKDPGYRECRITSRSMPDLGAWDLDNAISSLRPLDEEAADDADWDDDEAYPYDDRDTDRYERRYEDD